MTGDLSGPTTLFEKVWNDHVVCELDDDLDLLYVDMHLLQEVSSPQAFGNLELENRQVRRPDLTLAMIDHNIPTGDRSRPFDDALSEVQVTAMATNANRHGIPIYDLESPYQGIVHVVAPELGMTQPGMTILCGDSHTSTHGAFGALAFGIGTSEVESVLATQCIQQRRPMTMSIDVSGSLGSGVTAKDLILSIIRKIGVDGAVGHAIEYRGTAIEALSMEERMTVCNMSIEAGARTGMIAPDDVTLRYLELCPESPSGEAWTAARDKWKSLRSDPTAAFDTSVRINAEECVPVLTWGTTPGMSITIDEVVPIPADTDNPEQTARALKYMGLSGGESPADISVDRVFIGSCTNSRIEDLRAAAGLIEGQSVHESVRAIVVPGSKSVKRQAEEEGLDLVFKSAGFEWREPACSMCLGMNEDRLGRYERCASTSNRNFEGRQGPAGRTHLVSPLMAAAAAVRGHFVDVRRLVA